MKQQTKTIIMVAEMLLRQIEEARIAEDPIVNNEFIALRRTCDNFIKRMNRSCICCTNWQDGCKLEIPTWANCCKEFEKKENL